MFKSFKENVKSRYQRWLQACLALSKATPHLSYLCLRSLCFERGFYEITFGTWVTALFLNLNILNMPPLIKLMFLQFACSETFLGTKSRHEHKRRRKKVASKNKRLQLFRRTEASGGSYGIATASFKKAVGCPYMQWFSSIFLVFPVR